MTQIDFGSFKESGGIEEEIDDVNSISQSRMEKNARLEYLAYGIY